MVRKCNIVLLEAELCLSMLGLNQIIDLSSLTKPCIDVCFPHYSLESPNNNRSLSN